MQFFELFSPWKAEIQGFLPMFYLNEMVIKLTVLLGCKSRNEKTHFKVLLVTNGFNIPTLRLSHMVAFPAK